MDRPPQYSIVARMSVPATGNAIFDSIYTAILAFFVAVALFDLANYQVMPLYVTILSLLWLLIVTGGLTFSILDEGGIRRFLLNRLAAYSEDHFVEVIRGDDSDLIVQFGFTVRQRPFIQSQVAGAAITSVTWRTGQATAMVGRDMNDWHVALGYHCKGSKRWTEIGYREEDLRIVGPMGAVTETAAFGESLVAFLCAAGIELHATEDDCEFSVRQQGTTNT